MDKVFLTAVCLLSARASASDEVLPEPRSVHFHSVNFRNMVRWTPGERSLNETVYAVEYAVYGDEDESNSEQVRWRPVKQCTFIQQTECDVSQETFNLEDDYYARVKAVAQHTHSIWTETTTRFKPMTDTTLGPPLVDVTVVQNYINITMKGPFRWKTKKTKKEKSLWKIIPFMIYNVSVYSSRREHVQSFLLETSSLTQGPLDFSTRVCVVVSAQSQTLPLASTPSLRKCAETPKDVFKDQMLAAMLGGVLPSALCLCVLAVLGGLVHCYITDHKQTRPKSTNMDHVTEKHHTVQPARPQTIILNVTNIVIEEPKLFSPLLLLPPVSSVGRAQCAPPPAAGPQCYTQPHVPVPGGSAGVAADFQNESSETDGSWPQEHQNEEPEDYGIVLRAAAVTDMSLYRSQVNTTEPRQPDDEENEEEAQIFLDWSPDMCELKIPLASPLDVEDSEQTDTETEPDEMMLLTQVILRQCSEDSSEHEDDFTKMERTWGLIIHTNAE
ncbi:interleukin-20 receptor subunit alpha isoform X2 [Triplophysa dalaica]|uniref:interleukin-20 receptor subunit alpha isoform X2 n=1 Tax=Triplophysa dalaica TaxID=1582913 RepID=UPI0024E0359C|nr:interleukin-20 receptor subunit alpha isoform X2 [Triplophysa dalaica]